MKNVIIGGFMSLCGAIINAAIIISAGIYSSTLTTWYGSKFWYAIFGADQFGNEANLSLNLGFIFILSVVMLLVGIIIMLKELYKKKEVI